MMKAFALAMFGAVANASHLSGPMDDRLNACAAAKCPDFTATFGAGATDNYNGMEQTWGQFIGGQTMTWVTDLEFVLNTLGYVSPATCTETASTSVTADAAACAAVDALDDDTACEAVMTAADDQVAACTYAAAGSDFEAAAYDFKELSGTPAAATCAETATTSVDADRDACAAVTDLDDGAACGLVKKEGSVTAATCTETASTSVDADRDACAAVTCLDDNTACEAVMTAADDQVAACTYAPADAGDAACTYEGADDGYVEVTKAVTDDLSAIMACMCTECGAVVEAIFHPIGRDVCTALGAELPCAAELAACEATDAVAEAALYTGANVVGDRSKAYIPSGPPSTSKCSPSHSAFAYQADNTVYPLAEFTAEDDGTCSKAGVCRAIADADAEACAAHGTEQLCEGEVGAATVEDCVETAETSVTADADACDAVVLGDDAAANEAACQDVMTDATEECGADLEACTYVAAAAGAPKCEWVAAVSMDAETVALQECLATSRIEAYEEDFNCLEKVSGPSCGVAYTCTYVEEAEEDDKTSGTAVAAAAVSALAFVAANL